MWTFIELKIAENPHHSSDCGIYQEQKARECNWNERKRFTGNNPYENIDIQNSWLCIRERAQVATHRDHKITQFIKITSGKWPYEMYKFRRASRLCLFVVFLFQINSLLAIGELWICDTYLLLRAHQLRNEMMISHNCFNFMCQAFIPLSLFSACLRRTQVRRVNILCSLSAFNQKIQKINLCIIRYEIRYSRRPLEFLQCRGAERHSTHVTHYGKRVSNRTCFWPK